LKTSSIAAFEIQEAIENVYFNYKSFALHKQIEFYILSDLASQCKVSGDNQKFDTLLHTLFKSVLIHSGADEVALSIRQLLQTENDVLLEFCLTDNGTTHKTSKSFKYFRALATAKQLTLEMGGKSELISIPGMNTTFRFIIRFGWATEEIKDVTTAHSLPGRRILLAEDNEMNQRTIVKLLKQQGVTADVVSNGREAVDMVEKNPGLYDMVIMDLQMPFMDGAQATNFIRKKLKNNIPILVMTSGDDGQLQDYNLGINASISKPFAGESLIDKLKCLLAEGPSIGLYETSKIA
jgi:CheY-like chemotaxis protein